jgi:hypothetical protein
MKKFINWKFEFNGFALVGIAADQPLHDSDDNRLDAEILMQGDGGEWDTIWIGEYIALPGVWGQLVSFCFGGTITRQSIEDKAYELRAK